MKIKEKKISCHGIKLTAEHNGQEAGRIYLYIIKNNLHKQPLGLIEDLFVNENQRGLGTGTKLIDMAIAFAKQNNCYKIIATSRYSRPNVHKLYKRFDFKDYGIEFRMDLQQTN